MGLLWSGTCSVTGTRIYTTKRRAKTARRNTGEPGLSAYRCGQHWHLGHLPKAVREGRVSRRDYWRR